MTNGSHKKADRCCRVTSIGPRIAAPRARYLLPSAMSALGQKQTLDRRPLMSALPPKADIS
jgi:hypothetical protein